jgi:hypothetical protein
MQFDFLDLKNLITPLAFVLFYIKSYVQQREARLTRCSAFFLKLIWKVGFDEALNDDWSWE